MKDTFLQLYKGYRIFRRDSNQYGLRCHLVKNVKREGIVYFADGTAEQQIAKCKEFIDTL